MAPTKATWIEVTSVVNTKAWTSMASSSAGTKLTAVAYIGKVISGATWTEVNPVGDHDLLHHYRSSQVLT
jgi:hypothetical protein